VKIDERVGRTVPRTRVLDRIVDAAREAIARLAESYLDPGPRTRGRGSYRAVLAALDPDAGRSAAAGRPHFHVLVRAGRHELGRAVAPRVGWRAKPRPARRTDDVTAEHAEPFAVRLALGVGEDRDGELGQVGHEIVRS
jgi:hypothetical protein